MRKIRIATSVAVFAASLLSAQADSVVLKSGEVVEGKILRKSAAEVVIETRFSATITEERNIPQADIKSISETSPDLEAFEVLKKKGLPADAFDAMPYATYIAEVKDFIGKFPASAKVPEAREWIRAAEEEKTKVVQGQAKIAGVFLSKEEAALERYQIDARKSYQKVKDAMEQGESVLALNRYLDFEKSYAGSRIYPQVVGEAKETLQKLVGSLTGLQRGYAAMEEKRTRSMDQAKPAEQKAMADAKARQDAAFKTKLEDAKKEKAVFLPYSPNSMESMKSLQAVAEKQLQRISEINVAPMQDSLKLVEEAKRLIGLREFPTAQYKLKRALELWPANDSAKKMADALQAAVADQKKADERQATAVKEGFSSSTAEEPKTPPAK